MDARAAPVAVAAIMRANSTTLIPELLDLPGTVCAHTFPDDVVGIVSGAESSFNIEVNANCPQHSSRIEGAMKLEPGVFIRSRINGRGTIDEWRA